LTAKCYSPDGVVVGVGVGVVVGGVGNQQGKISTWCLKKRKQNITINEPKP
jgi:hypothetical protein